MAAASDPATPALSTGPLTVRFDGSVRDHPTEDRPSAAIGYVIDDSMAAARIVEEAEPLSCWVSNTHVEFDALIAALDHVLALGHSGHVNVNGDCKSVIELVDPTGHPTPNTRLVALYVQKARARLERFDSYTLNYVRRENNRAADKLADDGHALRAAKC